MIIQKRNKSYIEASIKFIELIGNKELISTCGFTRQNITGWKQRGIPKPWYLFLKTKYKKEWQIAFHG